MADDDLIEAEGNIAFGTASMFGDIAQDPDSSSPFVVDESEADLLQQYGSVRPFGSTFAFDFASGQFVRRGNGKQVQVVSERDAFAQWCMAVLHTERLTAHVYSDQIGVEIEDLVRGSSGPADISAALLKGRIEDALRVHDRYNGLIDYSFRVDGNIVYIDLTIDTTDGAVDVSAEVAA